MNSMKQLKETADFLRQQYPHSPEVGIVLGSGLRNFVKEISIVKEVPYGDIPHFSVSTVQGHSGKLIFGELAGKKVIAMAGRFHYYEGYTPQEVVMPIRVMHLLGVKSLLLSNAAGAVNPDYEVGDIMIIRDHISFFYAQSIAGKKYGRTGASFSRHE